VQTYVISVLKGSIYLILGRLAKGALVDAGNATMVGVLGVKMGIDLINGLAKAKCVYQVEFMKS
jgi:hypothetical protein